MPRSGCSKPEPAPEPTTVPCNVGVAIVFDVVAKACTEATSLLMFCNTSSDGVALVVDA